MPCCNGFSRNCTCSTNEPAPAARTWRATGGYQDARTPFPSMPPPPTKDMYCYPVLPPWMMAPPPPLAAFWTCQPAPPISYAPVQSSSSNTSSGKKSSKRSTRNPWAPPDLDEKDGVSYLFDKAENHTRLHIFTKAAPVWTKKYEKENLKFKMFKVSINFTLKMVIENTLKKSEDDCNDWAITEVFEQGRGKWDKGTTTPYDSDAANATLKSVGWSAQRGDSLPPVWVVVHKVYID